MLWVERITAPARLPILLRLAGAGESLPMISRLLGHSQMQTTARYAHLDRDSICESGRRGADRIEKSLYRDYPGETAAARQF